MQLLSPIDIGPIRLKNRVVSTAHDAFSTFFQPGNDGERYMAYQERRAEGGTGLIILTAMHVHASSQIPQHWVFDPETMAPKLQRLSTRLHRHGAKAISQLFHFGAVGRSNARDDLHPLWGFSALPTLEGEAVHEMPEAELEEVIEAFALAAKAATENGMDGVELHGTHGYLIQQSFSPYANRRTDRWGCGLSFAKAVAQRVRAAIGPHKAMGFRISSDDFLDPAMGGLGHEGLCSVAAGLMATGLFDYLNHSEGKGGADYRRAIGSYRHRFGEWLPLTKNLRNAIGARVPVIGVGKIPTPDLAEQALREGCCDLVGMTRAQIADPDLVRKLQSGQSARIRTCTGSNQGCIDRGVLGITCFQNPEVGEERRFRALDVPVKQPRKVLVVGGGPAGMKAAEVAARRGHEVTLAEAGDRLGGRLNLVEKFGDATNLLSAVSWIENELALLKVRILTHTEVDEAFVASMRPDAIILATGAVPSSRLDVPSDDSVPVLSTDDAARGEFNGVALDLKGTRTLFVDRRGDYETSLVIESLARRGSHVTVATPHLYLGVNLGHNTLQDYLHVLPKLGVEVLTTTLLVGIGEGGAQLRQALTGAETSLPCDCIVAGIVPHARASLFEILSRHAPVKLVGDAVAPRSALEAFREGDRAGRTI